MKYGMKNNIRVFWDAGLDKYVWNTPKWNAEKTKDEMSIFLNKLFSVIWSRQTTLNEAKFLNQWAKSTIQFLIDSEQFSLANIWSALWGALVWKWDFSWW
jgi:hypothetical protein